MEKWTTPRAWLVIMAWLAVMVIAFMGLGKLSLNNDYKVFFSKDNPDLVLRNPLMI